MIKTIFLGACIASLFVVLRLHNLAGEMNFGSDQGIQLLEIYSRYLVRQVSLIGPYSSFVSNGKYFFFGPLSYYLPIPWMIFFDWGPIASSVLMVFLQMVGLFLSIFIFRKSEVSNRQILIFSLLYSTIPQSVFYGRFFWNPNFLIPFASVCLSLMVNFRKSKNDLVLFFCGVLLGVGLQPHFSFLLFILFAYFYLVFLKTGYKSFIIMTFGIVIGFFPWIWFELRHNFYNLRIMLDLISTHNPASQKHIQEYYFVSFIPLCAYIISYLAVKVKKAACYFIFIFMCFLILFKTPVGIIPGWTYIDLKKVADMIEEDKPGENFNITDILTGDTRAMALRYILTTNGLKPKNVEDYLSSRPIYVYTNVPLPEIEKGNLWELSGIRPLMVTKKWQVTDSVILYRFD